jgi:hypothetical protein
MRAEALATLDALELAWTARGDLKSKARLAQVRRQRARLLPKSDGVWPWRLRSLPSGERQAIQLPRIVSLAIARGFGPP